VFGVGAPEALLIGLVALLVFGPARLTGVAREWGAVVGRARRELDEVRTELASADYPDEWLENRDREQEDLFETWPGD
jgi:sec-independent protein translocase protein TatB